VVKKWGELEEIIKTRPQEEWKERKKRSKHKKLARKIKRFRFGLVKSLKSI
jgi:hypothetical protein